MWKFPTQTTVQPKSILATVRFNVCVMLFSMNWTSGQLWLRVGLADPLSPRLKTTLIANQSDAPLPGGGGQPSISATTTDISQHVIPPSLHLIPSLPFLNSLFLNPWRHNKLTCPGLRLKTSLCATSLYFSEEKWECVYNPCVYCQFVLHALWPNDWSNCVLCTVTNFLLKLWFDGSEHW